MALLQQAEIAEAAGRLMMARNLERAADIVDVPQDVVLKTHELLRPGRAEVGRRICWKQPSVAARDVSGRTHGGFLSSEAAEVYERRGLFHVPLLKRELG